MFTKPLKARTLDDSFLGILNFFGGLDEQKTENADIVVQFFGHNSKTNPNIKNRNNSLISQINSEVNDIKMSLNIFDLNSHRFAH